ncbi:MAG: hypothetical protein JWO67_741 [Streptosporangiaceae bacterium]|nr:hypothetical protein [Streptosporangiaceae bacterium]
MGARGPVPTRSDQRRRQNKNPEGIATAKAPGVRAEQPPADASWHEMARDWYESLALSGQARWYQPSDWQTARVWAEVLSRQLAGGRVSAQMIAAWSGAATELLTTEGARRRARVELEVPDVDEDEEASVTALDRYRAVVGS